MLSAYLATLAWQVIWHALLPVPWGQRNGWLAMVACLPLLIPLAGMVRLRYRSMIWAGLILMLYLALGIMEAWINPSQRVPALIQVSLVVFYLFAFQQRNRA